MPDPSLDPARLTMLPSSAQARWAAVPAGLSNFEGTIASLQKDLERARGEYALRSYERVTELLIDVERRLPAVSAETPARQVKEIDFLRAVLEVLRGRLLSRHDSPGSLAAFANAVVLFDRHVDEIATHANANRLSTDFGIALYRLGWQTGLRMDEAIAVLQRVCGSGAAPPEAFGYLGYAQLALDDFAAAEAWLRKGIDLAPTDPTMLYWLARVLEVSGRAESGEAYCTAGEAAWNIQDYASAVRCGMRALRRDRALERGLTLVARACLAANPPRLRLASQVLERFLAHAPDSQKARGLNGMVLAREGELVAAAALLRGVATAAPELRWARFELARTLLEIGADGAREALAVVRALRSELPEEPALLRLQAAAHVKLNELEPAVAVLRELVSLDDSLESQLDLAGALYMRGDWAEAAAQFERIARDQPGNAWAHRALADCLRRIDQKDRAITSYRRAARLEPANLDIFEGLLETLTELGRKPEAADEIAERLDGPLRPVALQWQARLKSEDIAAAGADLEAAVEERPGDHPGIDRVSILADLAAVRRQAGRYAEARRIYERALQKEPRRLGTVLAYAAYLCDVGDFTGSLRRLEPSLAVEPPIPESWGLAGWCHQHLGDGKNALAAFQKAFDSSNGDLFYQKNLANGLYMVGEIPLAEEHFKTVLQKLKYQASADRPADFSRHDQNPLVPRDALALLGWCNYRLHRLDEAVRLFQTVLADGSHEYWPLWFDLALVLMASGRHELAVSGYERACDTVAKEEPERQRGLYHVALFDLVEAWKNKVVGAEAEAVIVSIRDRFAATGAEPTTLLWLADVATGLSSSS